MRELLWMIMTIFLGACANPAGHDVIIPVAPTTTAHYAVVQVLPDPYTKEK